MYRKTYAEIDCDVLKENVKEIVSKYDYKYYIGIVKANAYGHGDYAVNSLIAGGVNYLAASSLEECLSIRARNKDIPILCLEPINSDYLDICEKNNITITVSDMDYFKTIDKKLKLKCHLKIDSGMNRLGFKNKNEVKEVYDEIIKSNLYLEGVYTHFATSGIWDKYWDKQLDNFKEITSLIDLSKVEIVHLGRSLTLVNHPKIDFASGIRLGMIMYGFSQSLPSPTGLRLIKRNLFLKRNKISDVNFSNDLNLKTAFTLKSEIMCIKKVKAYEFVGYGAKYVADKDILVGIMPIG
ncbi:MAG: alanine racemase, partial [Bacilli bacterium]|nr:alanine racemase [Bacilli bacterium]